MAHLVANFEKHVDPAVISSFFEGLDRPGSKLDQIFSFPDLPNRETYEFTSRTSIGEAPLFEGSTEEKQSYERFSDNITPIEVASRIEVEHRLVVVGNLFEIDSVADDAGYSMWLAKEKGGSRCFMYAFSGEETDDQAKSRLIGDGKTLIASDHPSYGESSATHSNYLYSNYTSMKLNATGLSRAKEQFRRQTNDAGEIIGAEGDLVIAGPYQEENCRRMFPAENLPGGSLNDANPHQGQKYLIWDYITDYRWFLVNRRMMKKHMIFKTLQDVTIFRDVPLGNLRHRYVAYMMFWARPIQDYRFVIGAKPTSA